MSVPANITANVTFRGKASHLEEPDKGVNALDALVMTYLSIRNLVASMQKYKHVTAGMYIKKGGQAPNEILYDKLLKFGIKQTNFIKWKICR